MRTDSAAFSYRNKGNSREPIFVVELSFDSANTDLHYLCSKTVDGLTGNIINETLQSFSSTSQKINPEKALSTIGSISFECLDIGLTDLQRTKLQSGDGLKGKRVRVYKGFYGLDWPDYALIQTQVISDSVSFKDGVYSFQCADVQRQLRKNIFEVKETSLSSSLSRTATTIPVYDTSQFEMVKHPASPSGLTDAPNQTVGYLKIEDGDDVEIIRYTGKTSGAFTGCTRGVLGTRPLDITVNASEADKSKKITEYIYLEMAAPKLIYALLTGVIFGQVEALPDHWHLGVASNFIKTSDFTEIGSDWWDLSDNDKGVPAVIKGVEKEDGKKFIEEELLIMLGAYMPIYSTGEVGLKRMVSVLSSGGYDRRLDQDNVISYGELKHDLSSVINQIVISWNYIESRKGFTRRSILIDPDSIQKNGKSEPLELKLRALETSRHSYSTIKSRFDSLRDRFAGAPLRLQLTLAPTENDLEIGDVVRVNLPQIEDYTQYGSGLNRNFEVQRVTQDWIKGQVRVDLFGSTATASPVPEDEVVGGVVVENSFYNSAGTEISPANFGGAVTDSGGTTTITGTITLNGSSNVNSSSSIFYCNQDLTINAGAKIIINDNVQIRVKGFFQVNGTIDGKGRGYPGGLGVSTGIESNRDWPGIYRNSSYDAYSAANYGSRGFIDPTIMPQGGGVVTATGNASTPYRLSLYPDQEGQIKYGGARNYAPQLDLKIEGNSLLGLPSDLRGTSGIGGGVGVLAWKLSGVWQHSHYGGSSGGASGAGLAIVCGGADIGASGVIDTSGLDAAAPGLSSINHPTGGVYCGKFQHPSGSGGACGACYWLIVGSNSTAPTLDAQNSIATIGGGQDYANADDDLYTVIDRTLTLNGITARDFRYIFNNAKTCSFYEYSQPFSSSNAYQSCHKIQYVNYVAPVTGATPVYADDATFSLTEYTNTPKTTVGDRSTIEVAITPPSDENYSYSLVEYRKQGTDVWTAASPSRFESTFEVKSDGSIFDVRLRSVSKSGKTTPSSDVQTIAVTNVSARTSLELQSIYPLLTITGLVLDEPGTTFTGLAPNFEWDNANGELVYFSYYEVKIYNGGTLLRTEKSVSPFYSYSVEKNRVDYKAQTATDGFYTTVEIRVAPVSRYRNDLNDLYKGSTTTLTVNATTVNDPNNLRYYVIPSKTSDLTDDAGLGQTADWSNVSGANRPEDNATNGAQWEGNISGQPNRQNLLNNLVDISDWELGASLGSLLSVEPTGFTGASSISVEPGAFGYDELCWKVAPLLLAEDDGGLKFKNTVVVNPAKVYRISFWFKAHASGTLRFSPSNNSLLRHLSSNVVQVAPYQFNAATPETNKWFLVTMVVHPHNTTRVSTSGKSGIYDPETGNIISFFDEFKFVPGATTLETTLEYNDVGSTSERALFSRLKVEVIDGSELPLNALLGVPDNYYLKIQDAPALVNVSSTGSKLTGASNITVSKVSTGRYRITHNSGYSGKGVIVSPRASTIASTAVSSETSSNFDVFLYSSAGAATDAAFTLLVDPSYLVF